MWVRIPAWPVAALVSLSKTLNHNCFVLRMGGKAAGAGCCVMHVKEPRTLIVKEKGLDPVFLDSRLEHPAGWIYVCATNLLYYYYYYYLYCRIKTLGSCPRTIKDLAFSLVLIFPMAKTPIGLYHRIKCVKLYSLKQVIAIQSL